MGGGRHDRVHLAAEGELGRRFDSVAGDPAGSNGALSVLTGIA